MNTKNLVFGIGVVCSILVCVALIYDQWRLGVVAVQGVGMCYTKLAFLDK